MIIFVYRVKNVYLLKIERVFCSVKFCFPFIQNWKLIFQLQEDHLPQFHYYSSNLQMDSQLLKYYQTNNTSLLKQFLLNLPLLNQIAEFLGQSLFNILIQKIQVQQIRCGIPFNLDSNSTYVFLSAGMIIKNKQISSNHLKYHILRKSIKNRFNSTIINRQKQNQIFIPQQKQNLKQNLKFDKNNDTYDWKKQIKTITQNEIYNLHLLFSQKKNFIKEQFIMNELKKSAVIFFNHERIPSEIHTIITERQTQKLKFISNNYIFSNVQKNIIDSNLSKFKILKVYFDEFLLKTPTLRPDSVFFLFSGEVEICTHTSKELKKTSIIKAPTIFGFESIKYAKSITEICVVYHIEKKQMLQIFKISLDQRQRNTVAEQQIKNIVASMTMNYKNLEESKKINDVSSQSITAKNNLKQNNLRQQGSISLQFNESNQLTNMKKYFLKTVSHKINDKKKFRIQKHFTNFLNDRYAEFAHRKTEFLNRNSQSNDYILYKMKNLVSKQPEMNEIKQRLKIQRLRRIIRCKENIETSKKQNITSINLRKYEQFQEIKPLNKVNKKLQFEIAKRIRKNKLQKTFTPNIFSFNKMIDISTLNP